MTNSMVLLTCLSFLFTRIPFVLKLVLNLLLLAGYAVIIFYQYDYIYENSEPMNVGFNPEWSHLVAVIDTIVIFHLMDRQTEFISKVDYK